VVDFEKRSETLVGAYDTATFEVAPTTSANFSKTDQPTSWEQNHRPIRTRANVSRFPNTSEFLSQIVGPFFGCAGTSDRQLFRMSFSEAESLFWAELSDVFEGRKPLCTHCL